jgi:hypothetical protein
VRKQFRYSFAFHVAGKEGELFGSGHVLVKDNSVGPASENEIGDGRQKGPNLGLALYESVFRLALVRYVNDGNDVFAGAGHSFYVKDDFSDTTHPVMENRFARFRGVTRTDFLQLPVFENIVERFPEKKIGKAFPVFHFVRGKS